MNGKGKERERERVKNQEVQEEEKATPSSSSSSHRPHHIARFPQLQTTLCLLKPPHPGHITSTPSQTVKSVSQAGSQADMQSPLGELRVPAISLRRRGSV